MDLSEPGLCILKALRVYYNLLKIASQNKYLNKNNKNGMTRYFQLKVVYVKLIKLFLISKYVPFCRQNIHTHVKCV